MGDEDKKEKDMGTTDYEQKIRKRVSERSAKLGEMDISETVQKGEGTQVGETVELSKENTRKAKDEKSDK